MILLEVGDWALRRGEKQQQQQQNLAAIVPFGRPLIYETWGYFHGAALKYSGMCRVKKKLSSADGYSCNLPSKCQYPYSVQPAKIPLSSWSPVTSLQVGFPSKAPRGHTQRVMRAQRCLLATVCLGRCQSWLASHPFQDREAVAAPCFLPIACSELTPSPSGVSALQCVC